MVENRPSIDISAVFRPKSFINGIASDAKTSSASIITHSNLIPLNSEIGAKVLKTGERN